jgi:hypothetical protein
MDAVKAKRWKREEASKSCTLTEDALVMVLVHAGMLIPEQYYRHIRLK